MAKTVYEGWYYVVWTGECGVPVLLPEKLSEDWMRKMALEVCKHLNMSRRGTMFMVNDVLRLFRENEIHFMVDHLLNYTNLEREFERFKGRKVRVTVEVIE